MSNKIPERLINFRVFAGGVNQIGVATVEMPSLESMSDTVSGAGIAGEIESPLLGHLGSMTTSITFRTVTENAISLAAPKVHELEFRGSMQVNDAGNGVLQSVPVRVSMRVTPKNIELGNLEVGATTDTSNEFEVHYLKVFINNVERIEVDKLNFKYVVDGIDYLASVRDDLGL